MTFVVDRGFDEEIGKLIIFVALKCWYFADGRSLSQSRKNKPENVGQLEECCSIRPMGIHKYKQTHQIEQLDDQFYGPSNNKELTRLKGKTRRYADKVRRAMGFDQ